MAGKTYRFAFDEGYLQAVGVLPPSSKLLAAEVVYMPRAKRWVLVLEADQGFPVEPDEGG